MNKQSREFRSVALGKVAQVRSGYSFSSRDFGEIGTPVIRISDIYEGRISAEGAVKTILPVSDSGFILERKDFAIAMSGATTGKIGIFYGSKAFVNQRVGKFIVTDYTTIDKEYLYHFVSSLYFSNQLSEVLEQGAQPNISSRLLETFKINFPVDLNEQKAIAKALSDIDKLIAGLRVEIEKNTSIKIGLVQRNLKSLVPNSKLRDHATMASGGTPLTYVSDYYGGEIPWVSITDMTDSGKYIEKTSRNLTESGLLNSSAVIYPKNTLLFAMYASIGKCALPKVPVSSSQAILGITVKPCLNLDYLYYILTSRTQDFISMGQQGTQSNLNKIIVGDLDIPVLPLKVQERIADEFTAVDNKIDALKAELAKYECIKQGMAHDLLTGKVRLV